MVPGGATIPIESKWISDFLPPKSTEPAVSVEMGIHPFQTGTGANRGTGKWAGINLRRRDRSRQPRDKSQLPPRPAGEAATDATAPFRAVACRAPKPLTGTGRWVLFSDRVRAIMGQVQSAELRCVKFEIAQVSRVGVPASRTPTPGRTQSQDAAQAMIAQDQSAKPTRSCVTS